jgi:hypothetical protein
MDLFPWWWRSKFTGHFTFHTIYFFIFVDTGLATKSRRNRVSWRTWGVLSTWAHYNICVNTVIYTGPPLYKHPYGTLLPITVSILYSWTSSWGALGHVTHVAKPVTINKRERDGISLHKVNVRCYVEHVCVRRNVGYMIMLCNYVDI